MNHHKLTDTTNEYSALKDHVRKQLNKPSGNLSCISFHGVPYKIVDDSNTDKETFDIIDMKSHKRIEGQKGKLVLFTDAYNDMEFRIGLVEGLHRSHIFHQISEDISDADRRSEKLFKLTLYFGNPEDLFQEADLSLFSKLSYNLSLELRSGNEHTLFDAMHNCVTHIISNSEYTCMNEEGNLNDKFFVFVHSKEDISKLTVGKTDKKKIRALLKSDVVKQFEAMFDAKRAVEKAFLEEFILNLKHNRLVTQFIEKTPKTANKDLFNLSYLLSDNVPPLGPDTLLPLVTQSAKKKGTLICMRCITDGGCPLQLFFITSILMSTVMHSKFAEVRTIVFIWYRSVPYFYFSKYLTFHFRCCKKHCSA